jgi:hypothetical protein
MLLGSRGSRSSSSESITTPGANGTLSGRAGAVPVATSTWLAFTSVVSSSRWTRIVSGSTKLASPEQHGDAVPCHLRPDHLHLGPDDVAAAVQQVVHRDGLLDGVAVAVDGPLAESGQVEDGLPHGLGRDGAGVDADAADAAGPVDQRDPPAELGRQEGGLLPGGAGTDHDEVVAESGHNAGVLRHRYRAGKACAL